MPTLQALVSWERTAFHTGPIAEISGAEMIYEGNQRDAKERSHRVRDGSGHTPTGTQRASLRTLDGHQENSQRDGVPP